MNYLSDPLEICSREAKLLECIINRLFRYIFESIIWVLTSELIPNFRKSLKLCLRGAQAVQSLIPPFLSLILDDSIKNCDPLFIKRSEDLLGIGVWCREVTNLFFSPSSFLCQRMELARGDYDGTPMFIFGAGINFKFWSPY